MRIKYSRISFDPHQQQPANAHMLICQKHKKKIKCPNCPLNTFYVNKCVNRIHHLNNKNNLNATQHTCFTWRQFSFAKEFQIKLIRVCSLQEFWLWISFSFSSLRISSFQVKAVDQSSGSLHSVLFSFHIITSNLIQFFITLYTYILYSQL